MIRSVICNDCICLPMCFGKPNGKLISDCDFINNAINNICASLTNTEAIPILFTSLNREFMIERVGKQLIIKRYKISLRGDCYSELL